MKTVISRIEFEGPHISLRPMLVQAHIFLTKRPTTHLGVETAPSTHGPRKTGKLQVEE